MITVRLSVQKLSICKSQGNMLLNDVEYTYYYYYYLLFLLFLVLGCIIIINFVNDRVTQKARPANVLPRHTHIKHK